MFENLTLFDSQVSLDISLIQGDTREVILEFNDDAGSAIPLAGYDIKLTARTEPNSEAYPVFEKTIGAGISVDDNTVKVSFGAELITIRANVLYYDILFKKATTTRRFVAGKFFIKSSVTI
ncbi:MULTISPECIES: hypothetical protein [Sphingobacterium]|uniref:BppU N-terminal domain-containing protein n=1 Tax=Sphingobacterium populi TaxID=1812824 RepID=A0ABW5U9J4_9SPHI|nr:hypothetical protein [Sphingobacterium sp. CFCC 11742]